MKAKITGTKKFSNSKILVLENEKYRLYRLKKFEVVILSFVLKVLVFI